MVPPSPCPVPWQAAWQAPWQGKTGRGQRGGCPKNSRGGCPIPPFHCSLSLFGFSSYDRPTRTAPAVRGETGATPPF